MFGAVQFSNILILTLLCVLLFNLVKLTELPSVWERATYSAYQLLFTWLSLVMSMMVSFCAVLFPARCLG